VAEKGELGAATGSTKAVAAGQAPQGQEYIWTLVRGEPLVEGADDAWERTTVYATDGSCRACLFPLTNGATTKEADGGHSLTCGLCGTRYSLDTGEVLDFLPGDNPVRWAAKLANEKKGPTTATVLKTRVSKALRSYLRLPDGTLPITTRRVEGTLNEREEIAPAKGFAKK
jgi:nitrite reductase/ring-hydroxylating ferredoxin subunit